jgi:hypothetical protein
VRGAWGVTRLWIGSNTRRECPGHIRGLGGYLGHLSRSPAQGLPLFRPLLVATGTLGPSIAVTAPAPRRPSTASVCASARQLCGSVARSVANGSSRVLSQVLLAGVVGGAASSGSWFG